MGRENISYCSKAKCFQAAYVPLPFLSRCHLTSLGPAGRAQAHGDKTPLRVCSSRACWGQPGPTDPLGTGAPAPLVPRVGGGLIQQLQTQATCCTPGNP